MADLTITVEDASPVLFAAVPTMAFKLAITNAIPDERIQNIVLRLSAAALLPGKGYEQLYRDEVAYSVLGNLVLTY